MDDLFTRFKTTAKKLFHQFEERIHTDFHLDTFDPSIVLTNKRHQQTLQNAGILTCSFYLLTNACQRVAGVVSFHSGKPFLLTSAMGLVTTTASCILAKDFHDYMVESKVFGARGGSSSTPRSGYGNWLSWPPPTSTGTGVSTSHRRSANDEEMVRHTLVGMGLFALFERRNFLTAWPSSVITLGAYAQRNMLVTPLGRGYVPATDVTATDKQRRMIQFLGKRFGCHQCGSRQLFSGLSSQIGSFIADHQPPTKMAKTMSEKGWRRLLRWPVAQRLWPQCQKCFHLQGSAVRTHTHTLIYHHRLRLCHFAPAVAAVLLWSTADNPAVKECMDTVVVPTAKAVQQARIMIARAVS